MINFSSVGQKIAQLRKERGMTQMELADKMFVSFQAVSNWERGETMPDISKLPQLTEILGVSIDDILGNKRAAVIVESAMSDQTPVSDLLIEEIQSVAPILQTQQVDRLFEHVERAVTLHEMVALAPYISTEVLTEYAKQQSRVHGIHSIVAIVPFLEEEVVDELAQSSFEEDGLSAVISIVPFLSEMRVKALANAIIAKGDMNQLTMLAPFLEGNFLDDYFRSVMNK